MTKVVIILGVALGAVVLTVVILGLVAPKRISVKSTQFIRASKQQVFDQIRFMKNFPKWSPFRQQDPDQKYVISGIDGQIGATFSWEGVKERSKGSQKIIALSGNSIIKIQCNITEPFQSAPTFDYAIIEKEGGVEVVQDFDTAMPFPANVFGLLFGLKAKMAETNQQGLELLKQVSEQPETVSSN